MCDTKDPWGTPALTGFSCEDFLSRTTWSGVLLEKRQKKTKYIYTQSVKLIFVKKTSMPKFLINSFTLSDAEDNTFRLLNKEVYQIHLCWKHYCSEHYYNPSQRNCQNQLIYLSFSNIGQECQDSLI